MNRLLFKNIGNTELNFPNNIYILISYNHLIATRYIYKKLNLHNSIEYSRILFNNIRHILKLFLKYSKSSLTCLRITTYL